MWSDWTESAQRAFKHYGLDPTHRRYTGERVQGGGWCDFCVQHTKNTPRILCDLEQARAAEMAELGFECSCCAHCKEAYPKMFNRAAICPACQRAQDERDAEVRAGLKFRRTGGVAKSGVRVPDGLGCTEKLPAWMLDWDGDPNG